MKYKIQFLCATAAILMAGQASADTSWTLNTGTVQSGGVTANSTGWANTGGSGTSGNDNTSLELQNLTQWTGGLGIYNKDGCSSGTSCDVNESQQPEHAIDNNQRYEMVLLSFSELVNLTGFNIGWKGNDSDMTIMAFTGAGVPATLSNQKWSDLAANNSGWSLIGNYLNVTTSRSTATNSGVFSSFWLIGAYNPLVATGSSTGYAGNDYVKLASVTGNVCTNGSGPSCTPPGNNVPEPGSFALLGLGLLGMIGLRKRQIA